MCGERHASIVADTLLGRFAMSRTAIDRAIAGALTITCLGVTGAWISFLAYGIGWILGVI
jgi:hypothetical protein